MISIDDAKDYELRALLRRSQDLDMPYAREVMRRCLGLSYKAWVGKVDDEIACVWGVIPPTILSDRAYLWLLANDLVEQHKFTFVRHSQIVIEGILNRFETILGHVDERDAKARRWLAWLGAKFEDGQKRKWMIPFRIERR
jgi:hypothetical protein